MNFISKYFENKRKQQIQDAREQLLKEQAAEKLVAERAAIEAEQRRAEDDKIKAAADEKLRMESPVPWYELIGKPYDLESPPIEPINERYRWNKAWITHLREGGYVGEYDHEVISDYEKKTEHKRVERLLVIQREEKKKSSEPWVEIMSENYDEDEKQVVMNLDWNQAFIKMLRQNGFTGRDDHEIVDRWFKTVSESIAGDIHGQRYDA